jgi:tetratricopeptide (TPR) repeat protein
VVLLLRNKPIDALAICDDVLAQSPKNVQAIMLRGEICEALGEDDEAIVAYQSASELMPHNSQANAALRRLRLAMGRVQPPSPQQQRFGPHLQPVEVPVVTRQVAYQTASPPEAESAHESVRESAYESFDARIAGDDKSYRLTYEESEPPSMPTANPLDAYFAKLQQTITEGQRRDRLDRERPPLPLQFERLSEDEDPASPDIGPQVVRFDMGLGADTNPMVTVPPIRTTGHSSVMLPSRPFNFSQASRVPKHVPVVDTCQPSRGGLMLASRFVR